jgi:hypothetical protein
VLSNIRQFFGSNLVMRAPNRRLTYWALVVQSSALVTTHGIPKDWTLMWQIKGEQSQHISEQRAVQIPVLDGHHSYFCQLQTGAHNMG